MKKLKATEKGCFFLTLSAFDKIQVRVTIDTVITNGCSRERLASEAFGMAYVNDKTVVCSFVEKHGDAGETRTVVKIESNRVTIQRSGSLNMRQQLVIGKKTEGFYSTPYGRMMMEAKTETIQFAWDKLKRAGLLHVNYDLWMQTEYAGRYDITIQMEGVSS